MTGTGLWLRLGAGITAAVGSILLIPIPAPTTSTSAEVAALVGCLGGIALFVALAHERPVLRLDGWSRRDTTRSSFFLVWAGVEEALWRRLALGAIAIQAGWISGLIGSTIAFAYSHRVGRTSHLVTGFGFGAAYLGTGQLLSSIVMHAVYNLLLDRSLRHSAAVAQTA